MMLSRRRLYPVARWYGCHVHHRGSHRLLTLAHPTGRSALKYGFTAIVPFDNGLRLEVETTNWVGWHIYFRGVYRPEALAAVDRYVPQGGVAIDIGASLGDFTVAMARAVGPDGTVHAFEPWPAEAARCRRNVRLNRLTNVHVVEQPVSDSSVRTCLHGSTGFNQSAASFAPPSSIESDAAIERTSIRLDEYMQEHGRRVDFMKVDSQGADLKVLRGAAETLLEWGPVVLISSMSEPHYRAQDSSSAEIVSFLTRQGYRLEWLRASAPVPTTVGQEFDSEFLGTLVAVKPR